MAPVSRRPGTRGHPSSTQEENIDLPLLRFDDDDNEQKENHVLTQLEDCGRVNVSFAVNDTECRPQLDNPSAVLPGDPNDVDTALEQYLLSQNHVDQQQEEFSLDLVDDESSAEEDDNNHNDNNNAPSHTQGTLDAASILVGGFGSVDSTNAAPTAARSVRAKFTAARKCPPLLKKRPFRDDSDDDNDDEDSDNDDEEDSDSDGEDDEEEKLAEPKQKTSLASSIAAQLRTHGLTGTGLTKEEIQFVDNVDEGKNKKQHDGGQLRYEKRFFETLAQCGGDILAPLSKDQVPNPHDTQELNRVDHSFYSICGGDKTADKHAILNKCFILCGMKWQCLSGKNKGKTTQPNSFCKMMQCLTYLFNRKGVKHLFNEDFNSKGDFHGVMKVTW